MLAPLAMAVDKETKLAAMMLSALLMTPDDELGDFRTKRLGRGSGVDLAHIRRVREILGVLAESIKSDEEDQLALVQQTWRLLLERKADDVRELDDEPTCVEDAPPEEPAAPPSSPKIAPPSPKTVDKESAERAPGPSLAAAPPPRMDSPVEPPRVGVAVGGALPQELAARRDQASPWVTPGRASEAHSAAGSAPSPPPPRVSPPLPPPSPAPVAPAFVPAAPVTPLADTVAGPGSRTQMLPITAVPVASSNGQSPDSALPFRKGAASDPHESEPVQRGVAAIEGYAALCALCSVFPDRIHEMHARYGVGALDERYRIDGMWRQRFAEAPAEHELFDVLYTQFHHWLTQHARG